MVLGGCHALIHLSAASKPFSCQEKECWKSEATAQPLQHRHVSPHKGQDTCISGCRQGKADGSPVSSPSARTCQDTSRHDLWRAKLGLAFFPACGNLKHIPLHLYTRAACKEHQRPQPGITRSQAPQLQNFQRARAEILKPINTRP